MIRTNVTPLPEHQLRRRDSRCMALTLALVTLIGLSSLCQASAEDSLAGDLFSEISMSETVANLATTKSPSVSNANRVLGSVSLAKTLSSQGIQCEVQSQGVVVGLSELLTSGSEFETFGPLRLTVDPDSERIDVVMQVGLTLKGKTIDGNQWMELLAALGDQPNVQLVGSEQTLALHTSLSNRMVTADQVRVVAERLVSAAAKTLSQFSTIDQAPAAADVQPTTQIASSSEAVSNASVASVPIIADDNSLGLTTESLVGTWSAKTSATEAWAIRFENEGRFLMVYTSSGKNSVSRGQFSITAKRLVLSESAGTTLSGMLETDSNDRFAWKLQDKAGNSLTTLKFSKQ